MSARNRRRGWRHDRSARSARWSARSSGATCRRWIWYVASEISPVQLMAMPCSGSAVARKAAGGAGSGTGAGGADTHARHDRRREEGARCHRQRVLEDRQVVRAGVDAPTGRIGRHVEDQRRARHDGVLDVQRRQQRPRQGAAGRRTRSRAASCWRPAREARHRAGSGPGSRSRGEAARTAPRTPRIRARTPQLERGVAVRRRDGDRAVRVRLQTVADRPPGSRARRDQDVRRRGEAVAVRRTGSGRSGCARR